MLVINYLQYHNKQKLNIVIVNRYFPNFLFQYLNSTFEYKKKNDLVKLKKKLLVSNHQCYPVYPGILIV